MKSTMDSRFLVSAWERVQAKLNKFGLHGNSRDAEPPGGFGLIALGLLDGADEKLAFGGRVVDDVGPHLARSPG